MTRILVVGDSPGLEGVLRDGFESTGGQVVLAGDWRGFVAAISDAQPPVVILDADTPGMERRTLAEEARQVLSPRASLLLHSDMPEAELRYRVQQVGASGHLHARTPSGEVVARVREAVRAAGSFDVPLSMPLTMLTSGRDAPPDEAPLPLALETRLAWQPHGAGRPWLPRVLLVEGAGLRRHFLRHWFDSRGFPEREEVADGAAALDLLRSRPQAALPELILADLEDPAGDGRLLCEALEEDPRGKDIERVFFSSVVTPRGGAPAASQGAGRPRHRLDVVHFEKLERHLSQRIRSMETVRRLRQARTDLGP